MENKKYICPVCGYDRLNEAPYGEDYKKTSILLVKFVQIATANLVLI